MFWNHSLKKPGTRKKIKKFPGRSGKIYDFAKTWYYTKVSARVETFTIYRARSPLTEQGFAGHVQHNCPNCKTHYHDGRVIAAIQMVLI